jgi:hypothetical protein
MTQGDPEVPEEELVPEDDRVIGRAVQRSLLALLALAVVFAAVYAWRHGHQPVGPERKIAAVPPKSRTTDVAPPHLPFTDVAAAAGIHFVHQNGAYGEKLLPESMGGGVAFLDYDNDGDPDLLFVNGTTWPWHPTPGPPPTLALYQNDGTGHFRDVTAESGLAVALYGMGVAVGDYDGDGWEDVLVTGVGGNRLFQNRLGRFVDVTAKAGVGGDPKGWTTCAAFFDYDNDGRLDLFVGSYVKWSRDIDLKVDYKLTGVGRAYGPPNNYEGTFSRLYHNEGNGSFKDVTEKAGLAVKNSATGLPMGKALGVVPIDVDGDGKIDLIVANDTAAKFFFHNKGNGTFEEMGSASGLAFDRMGNATGAMGIDAGHYRNDKELGILVANFANEMTAVYVSQGDPTLYADEAITEGVGAPSRRMLKFGLFLFDADLDGRLDLLQADGHLETEIAKVDPSQTYQQPAQLYWNAGTSARQTFVLVPGEQTGDLAKPVVGRGSAYADIDNDGDLDVVITQITGPPLLLRNDQNLGHHWLRLKLKGAAPNPDAIGAWVEVRAGALVQRRQVMPTKSYLSQSELPLTFGLGAVSSVDSIKVRWPNGQEETVSAEIDKLTVIEQGKREPEKR